MKNRLHLLDALRGWTLLNMIAYHGMWNLAHLYGKNLPGYTGPTGYLWQQSICWTFILLAGFCWSMSRSHWKRGLIVFGGGVLVSAATHLFMPGSAITFGILTFTGSAVLLMIPLEKGLKKIPALPGLLVCAMLFVLLRNVGSRELGFEDWVLGSLPDGWYQNLVTAYLGFPPRSFRSADYFPLIPWLVLFVVGYFLYRIFNSKGWDRKLFSRGNIPVLNFLGRHSLVIYLIHQPLLYAVMELIF